MQTVGCKEALNIAKRQDWYKAYVRNTLSQLSFFRKEYPKEENEDKRNSLKYLFFCDGVFSISGAFSWAGSPEGHDWWCKTVKEFQAQNTRNFTFKEI